MSSENRVLALVAMRRVDLAEEKWGRAFLDDLDPEVRFECLRWIADAVLTGFSPEVERVLSEATLDYRLFEAALATWNTLRGEPGAGVTNPDVLTGKILDSNTPPKLKGYALRLAPPAHPKLTLEVLRDLLATGDADLSLEVVRTLAAKNSDEARIILAEIASDDELAEKLRADAVSGLAASNAPEHRELLFVLAGDGQAAIRDEALRALRGVVPDDEGKATLAHVLSTHPDTALLVKTILEPFSLNEGRPGFEDTSAWLKRLDAVPGEPDPEAGRRVFFHSRLALCSSCHRHGGRGVVLGPDLSLAGKQGDREALLRSILEPHREVAPQFYPSQVKLKDGTEFIGILLRSSNTEVFRDLTGQEKSFPKTDVVERTELRTSLMPPGLVSMLTDRELRDLLDFLAKGG
jgi:hypothetical protein